VLRWPRGRTVVAARRSRSVGDRLPSSEFAPRSSGESRPRLRPAPTPKGGAVRRRAPFMPLAGASEARRRSRHPGTSPGWLGTPSSRRRGPHRLGPTLVDLRIAARANVSFRVLASGAGWCRLAVRPSGPSLALSPRLQRLGDSPRVRLLRRSAAPKSGRSTAWSAARLPRAFRAPSHVLRGQATFDSRTVSEDPAVGRLRAGFQSRATERVTSPSPKGRLGVRVSHPHRAVPPVARSGPVSGRERVWACPATPRRTGRFRARRLGGHLAVGASTEPAIDPRAGGCGEALPLAVFFRFSKSCG